jgi:hypothetical protein
MVPFIPVDSDFDSLPYAFANDNCSPIAKFMQGCRELWAAVPEEAFHSIDLGAWVRSGDFDAVCEFAGVEPSVMRVAAAKIMRGELHAQPRVGRNKHKGAGKAAG